MATATIDLYKTQLTPSKNALVDDLQDYLDDEGSIYTATIQYQKIDLDMSVKVDMNQSQLNKQNVGNYAKIVVGDQVYYFFITNATWKSEKTVELMLSIDSINTFRYDLAWSDKTTVIREHKDRFKLSGSQLIRIVDNTAEGISGALQLKQTSFGIVNGAGTTESLYLNQPWLLIYRSPEDIDYIEKPWFEQNNAITVELCPKLTQVPYGTGTAITKTLKDAIDGYSGFTKLGAGWYFMRDDNPSGSSVTVNNSTTYNFNDSTIAGYEFRIDSDNNQYKLYIYELTYSSTEGELEQTSVQTIISTTYDDIRQKVVFTKSSGLRYMVYWHKKLAYILSRPYVKCLAYPAGVQYISSGLTVDRTSQNLIKVIECPYLPINVTWSTTTIFGTQTRVMNIPDAWTISSQGKLMLSDLNTEFSSNIYNLSLSRMVINKPSNLTTLTRNKLYESKLYHSDFYTFKFGYDSFNTQIFLENLDVTTTLPSCSIQYKQPKLSSNLGFKFTFNNSTYTEKEDFGKYLLSTRSNDSPIYTSEYINYLRTGYSYDRKETTNANIGSWIGATVSLVGGVVSLAAAGASGGISAVAGVAMIGTAITTLTTGIINQVQSESSLAQKINQLKEQANSVSQADDLELFDWYSGNKLYYYEYAITDKLQNQMWNLFHYCGYATNVQKEPDTTSRYWFNYIQCEPVFEKMDVTDVLDKYISDIKVRYSAGVTVYHRHNREYDWNQEYENFETSLM